MRDSFEEVENGTLYLQPNSYNVKRTYTFTVNSSALANDGFVPFGETVASIAVVGYKISDNTVVTSALIIGIPTVADNVASVYYKYPGEAGNFKITIIATFSGGGVDEADFTRIVSMNI